MCSDSRSTGCELAAPTAPTRKAGRMKRLPQVLFLTILCLFAGTLSVSAFSVTDALGRSVEFDAVPDRIVIAGRGLLMVADALYLFPEASDRLIGVEKITQGRGNFLSVVDPDFGEKRVFPVNVGAEEIPAVRPDAVLLKSYMKTMLGEACAASAAGGSPAASGFRIRAKI